MEHPNGTPRRSGLDLAFARKAAGLTQATLAGEMGFTRERLSSLERMRFPSVAAVARFDDALERLAGSPAVEDVAGPATLETIARALERVAERQDELEVALPR